MSIVNIDGIKVDSDNYYNVQNVQNNPQGAIMLASAVSISTISATLIIGATIAQAYYTGGIIVASVTFLALSLVPIGNEFIYGKHGYYSDNFLISALPHDTLANLKDLFGEITADSFRYSLDVACTKLSELVGSNNQNSDQIE
jgi:hypothetical protein